ncbi:diguanylate cyclase [Oryzomonas japonica]|uniref:Diguanylate cyclase n=1 Tax=Oryzomonas japonica TaxID=2603858 RepID=A0A7J4ZQA0_9BACT|nr:NifB/NifX family molybdenum-iron cluster-binding protein [Oryzomonas japonica]KAB0665051.1 diguanylate cyclase [Oryzomonas japonica]
MKICFPVASDAGLESPVYNHFGSAPLFVVVDTETRTAEALQNNDQQHQHGACSPLKALGTDRFDGIVVTGIGGGALNGLHRMGLKVFQAYEGTIGENVDRFVQGALSEFLPQHTCGGHGQKGHGHGGSCCH